MRRQTLVVLSIALVGVFAMGGVLWLYFYKGGFSGKLSTDAGDWGVFGDYFGGLLNPIMGLISIVILAYTLLQQEFQLTQQYKENLKQDLLRLIDKVQSDLNRLTDKEVCLENGETVLFGDLIDGLVKGEPKDKGSYAALVKRLFIVQSQYYEALSLYKDNINPYFIFRAHRKRLDEIVLYLDRNQNYLSDWDRQINIHLAKELTEKL